MHALQGEISNDIWWIIKRFQLLFPEGSPKSDVSGVDVKRAEQRETQRMMQYSLPFMHKKKLWIVQNGLSFTEASNLWYPSDLKTVSFLRCSSITTFLSGCMDIMQTRRITKFPCRHHQHINGNISRRNLINLVPATSENQENSLQILTLYNY